MFKDFKSKSKRTLVQMKIFSTNSVFTQGRGGYNDDPDVYGSVIRKMTQNPSIKE